MSDYPEFESKMKKTTEVLSQQLEAVRAGRANAAVLNQISVEYYGVPTPIQQVASVSVPDPRTLMIQPWDASILKGIEKAILASELGINPQNDGRVIRLVFPQLTEERRQEVRRRGKGRSPQYPPRRHRQVQEAAEGIRDHRGRLQEYREGHSEAHRRLYKGSRRHNR